MKSLTLSLSLLALLLSSAPSFADSIEISPDGISWRHGNGGGFPAFPDRPWRPGRPGRPGPGFPFPGDRDRTYREVVRCSSGDYRFERCFIPGRIRHVELVRQRSNIDCSLGRSWGYERNSIWVDRGCRADFLVYYVR